MVLIPYKRKVYCLKLNEDQFCNLFNKTIKKNNADYRGFFADPYKEFRGNIDIGEKKFLIERNLGSLRGFKPVFDGRYFKETNYLRVEIIIKADWIHYILFICGTILLFFMMYLNKTPIFTIHGSLTLYLFLLCYFHYDSFKVLGQFEKNFKSFLTSCFNS